VAEAFLFSSVLPAWAYSQDPTNLRPSQIAKDGGNAGAITLDEIKRELNVGVVATSPLTTQAATPTLPVTTARDGGVQQLLGQNLQEARANLVSLGGETVVTYADQLIKGWVDTPKTLETSRVFTERVLLDLLEEGVQKNMLFGDMPSHTLTAKILRIDGDKRQKALSSAKAYIQVTIEETPTLKAISTERAALAGVTPFATARDGGVTKLASVTAIAPTTAITATPITTTPITTTPIATSSVTTTAPLATALDGAGKTAVEALPAVTTVTNISALSEIVSPTTLGSLQYLLNQADSAFQRLPAYDYRILSSSPDVLQDLGVSPINSFRPFTLAQFSTALQPFKLLAAGQSRFDIPLSPTQFKMILTPGELNILRSSPAGQRFLVTMERFENRAQRILTRIVERSAQAGTTAADGATKIATARDRVAKVALLPEPQTVSSVAVAEPAILQITETALTAPIAQAVKAHVDTQVVKDLVTPQSVERILGMASQAPNPPVVTSVGQIYFDQLNLSLRGQLYGVQNHPLFQSVIALAEQAKLQNTAATFSQSIFLNDPTLTQEGLDLLLKRTEGRLFFLPRNQADSIRLNIPKERVVSQLSDLSAKGINGIVVAFLNHADRLNLGIDETRLLLPDQTIAGQSHVTPIEVKVNGANALTVVEKAFALALHKGDPNALDDGAKLYLAYLADLPSSHALVAEIKVANAATVFAGFVNKGL